MTETPDGLERMVALLADEVVRRSTGVLSAGGQGEIFLVFGHPLHATFGDREGLAAVDAIRAWIDENPAQPVTWVPGRTAGRAHSLSPGDGVIERLRGAGRGQFGSGPAGDATESDLLGDLQLRRLAAQASVDEPHGSAVEAICHSLEARLHRHAQPLVEVIRAAEPGPAGLLRAIERARSMPLRAVSRDAITELLDAAAEIARKGAPAG